jgi:drug/metabolite transporter (DMT)-like permease
MRKQSKAYIFAVFAVLFWSTVATAFKIGLKSLSYSELLLFSSFFSMIILFIILSLQRKLGWLSEQSIKEIFYSALLGFLNPFLYYLILFKAYELLPAQEALTLNYTWAIVVVLLSIPMLGQRIRVMNFIALFVSFSGVVVIATHGDLLSLELSEPRGVLLALISAFVWAIFWLMNLKDKRDEVIKLSMNFVFGFAYILVYQILIDGVRLPEITGILSGVYIGCFEMGVTFVLWLLALKYSETTAKVSNLIYLSPFLSLIFIALILHEAIHISSLFGLILIISGILIQQIKRVR